MSRYTGLLQTISCLSLILIVGLGQAFADDIPLPLGDFLQHPEIWGYSRTEILVWNFCVTVVIEYLVICAFLGWPERAMVKLIFWVLLMNVVTNPAAQVGAIFLGKVMGSDPLAWVMIFVVEVVVVTVEFYLMTWLFTRMHCERLIDEPVTRKLTVETVVIANLASFIFGFVGLLGVLMELRN